MRPALFVLPLLLMLCHLIAFCEDTIGTGTAFIVHPDGFLITCEHVIRGAKEIQVIIGANTYDASVLEEDVKHDLALLQIQQGKLQALPLANSNMVQLGEEVRACGFPLAHATGKDLKVTRGTISGIMTLGVQKAFQVDAPINAGNSGGPLINEKGEVVGVVNAKLTAPEIEGVGFSVPINYIRHMLELEGIEAVEGKGVEKLDGPTLVKRVSASIAFVKVTISEGADTEDGTISAKTFNLVNDDGDVLTSLYVDPEDGQPVFFMRSATEKASAIMYIRETGPTVIMSDKAGDPRLALEVDADGDPIISLFNQKDKLSLALFAIKGGASGIELRDGNGKVRSTIIYSDEDKGWMSILNEEGKAVWTVP